MNPYLLYIIASIAVVPAILFGLYAQIKVMVTFSKYSKRMSNTGLTASGLGENLLYQNNCDVRVERTSGHLSDHYDPKRKVVALSTEVYNSKSIAALGIAAHEVGHAVQDEQNYAPLKIRHFAIKSSNVINMLLMPLIIIGMIGQIFFFYDSTFMMYFILALAVTYGISFLISIITLPTEFNASRRAKVMLHEAGLDSDEERGASKVLNAAALTYVAAMVISLVYFLRFLSMLLIIADRK